MLASNCQFHSDFPMWSHHLRLALRTLARDKGSAALGGLSLAVAVAACILIALFVREELSYNRALPNADRISAIGTVTHFGGERSVHNSTPSLLAPALVADAPAVEAATLTYGGGSERTVLEPGDGEQEVALIFGDSLFFDVFAYPFLAGDREAALDTPDGAVITASTARRLFGSSAPLGETFAVARGDTMLLTVRGVIPDLPELSTIRYDVVASFAGWRSRNANVGTGWGSLMYQTYALRRAGTDPGALQTALASVNQTEDWGHDDTRFLDVPLVAYRLSELSPAEGFGGDSVLPKVFSAVALLILLLGAINYVNLATARGARRAKEIGVRKVLGSGRGALVRQFLTESTLLSVLAAVVGLALAALALPLFNETFGVELALADLDAPFLGALGVATLAIGVLAGLYPALYLSGFEPLRVLRGTAASARAGGDAFLARTWLRRGLVVFQFAAAVLLLVGTASVVRQLDYYRGYPLGLEPENLVVVPITDPVLSQQSDVVKRAFQATPGVVSAAGAAGVPPRFYMGMGMPPDPEREDLNINYKVVDADHDYADVLGLTLAAGRWTADTPDDQARAVVVNEAFAEALGWTPEQAVGREIHGKGGDGLERIVGVVDDFHFESFREPVASVLLGPAQVDAFGTGAGNDASYSEIAVRLDPANPAEAVEALRATWTELAGDAPFEPRYIADEFDEIASGELRLARTFGLFAGIAVLIAALGLVGLATYTAERRQKELGIRKVLGASVGGLVGLLSREYLALVALAAVLAAPVAVVLVRRWLEGFVYHAPFSPLVLVGAAGAVLVLALASVGVQALRAARRDPIHTLRSE